MTYKIFAPLQKRASGFLGGPCKSEFKTALVKLMIVLWWDDANPHVLYLETYVSIGGKCFLKLKVKTWEKKKRCFHKAFIKEADC